MTARDIKRKPPEEVTALARDVLLGRKMVLADAHAVRSAFYMVLAFISMTEAATKLVGGLIGDLSETVPGRGMNGYPIFLSVGFLHKADAAFYDAELTRLMEAIGEPAGD